MQEKSIKPFQQKLDALTELPDGISFDAAHSWIRMEEKLTGKQTKQKRVLWYMAAAASILLVISIVYFNQSATITPVVVKPGSIIKEQPGATESKNNISVLNTETKENKPTDAATLSKTAKKLNKEKVVEATVNNLPANEPELVAQINTTQEIKVETTLPETTATSAPVIAAPVKQKIIHINELLQEHQLEQQRVAEAKRNQKPAEEEISTDKNAEPSRPWYKKSKHILSIKNQ
jgi:hypothetical protein